MSLPPAIETYFAADRGMDDTALIQVLAQEATVTDEGHQHTGRDEIRAWWLAAKAKYHHVAEPLGTTTDGERITIHCRVSGQFPNSPAMIDFTFTLADGLIQTLEIA
jgi:hypothetical protein